MKGEVRADILSNFLRFREGSETGYSSGFCTSASPGSGSGSGSESAFLAAVVTGLRCSYNDRCDGLRHVQRRGSGLLNGGRPYVLMSHLDQHPILVASDQVSDLAGISWTCLEKKPHTGRQIEAGGQRKG